MCIGFCIYICQLGNLLFKWEVTITCNTITGLMSCTGKWFSSLHPCYGFNKYLYFVLIIRSLNHVSHRDISIAWYNFAKLFHYSKNRHSCSLFRSAFVPWKLGYCQVIGALFRMKTSDTGCFLHAFIEGDKAGEAGPFGRLKEDKREMFKGSMLFLATKIMCRESFF